MILLETCQIRIHSSRAVEYRTHLLARSEDFLLSSLEASVVFLVELDKAEGPHLENLFSKEAESQYL